MTIMIKALENIKTTKRKISILKVILGILTMVLTIFLIGIILYFTGIIDMSPKGFDTQLSGSGIKICSYTGDDKEITIPETINAKPVVAIDKKVFYNNNKIEKVILPKSLKKIGDSAFANCSNLKEVTFNSSYTDCGRSLFENSSVEKAVLPKKLQKISERMFKNCKSVTAVSFPDDLKIIGKEAFSGCTSIKSMIIGASVLSIGEKAFENMGSDFFLSSVIGSPTETYAINNNIEYNPCNSNYSMYSKFPLYLGTNKFNSKDASDNKIGVLTFEPNKSDYYRFTMYKGKNVNFKINSAIKSVQECSSIRNNKNDFICYLEVGKTYYFQVTSKFFTDYFVDVQSVSQRLLDMYKKGENHLKGIESCMLKAGTALRLEHSIYSEASATVSSDILLDKVLDYYIDSDNTHIWYKINAKVGSSKQRSLWFKTK